LPEMSAKVSFLSGKENQATAEPPVLLIPQSALGKRDGRDVVYRVKENKAEEVAITVGRSFGAYAEITTGLLDGERVIDNPNDRISDGVKVSVK